jgi:uncharacterized protein YjbI with pentapeptide repeats
MIESIFITSVTESIRFVLDHHDFSESCLQMPQLTQKVLDKCNLAHDDITDVQDLCRIVIKRSEDYYTLRGRHGGIFKHSVTTKPKKVVVSAVNTDKLKQVAEEMEVVKKDMKEPMNRDPSTWTKSDIEKLLSV